MLMEILDKTGIFKSMKKYSRKISKKPQKLLFANTNILYSYADNSSGIGIIAVGNNGGSYFTVTNGSGAAFTGYHGSISTAKFLSLRLSLTFF